MWAGGRAGACEPNLIVPQRCERYQKLDVTAEAELQQFPFTFCLLAFEGS